MSYKKLLLLCIILLNYRSICAREPYVLKNYLTFNQSPLSGLEYFNDQELRLLFQKPEDPKDYEEANKIVDISFMCADIKYDGQNLKFLEFGEAKNASFERVIGQDKAQIWGSFLDSLKKFSVPFWLVEPFGWIEWFKLKKVAWDAFTRANGCHVSSLFGLARSNFFIKQNNLKRGGSNSNIADCVGILMTMNKDYWYPKELAAIEGFKKRYPNVVVVDSIFRPYGANKYLMNLLFQDSELKKYRPRCNVYSKKYSPDLAKKIAQDLSSEYYVIKPLNSARGNGVLFVHASDLDNVLKKILLEAPIARRYSKSKKRRSAFNYRPHKPHYYRYWIHDKNSFFMVEECVGSKTVLLKDKKYDPVLRVFLVLHHNRGEVFFKLLANYWWFPKEDLDAEVSFLEKHKTFVGKSDTSHYVVQLEPADKKKVEETLSIVMPKVYKKMIWAHYKTQKRFKVK